MGQYHRAVSLDAREFLDPHQLGDGLKLCEQAWAGTGGVGSALVALLAASNGPAGRGGGDFRRSAVRRDGREERVVGRWAGHRVALVGDYAERGDLPPRLRLRADLIYGLCRDPRSSDPATPRDYRDITPLVAELLGAELGIEYSGTGWRDRKVRANGDADCPSKDAPEWVRAIHASCGWADAHRVCAKVLGDPDLQEVISRHEERGTSWLADVFGLCGVELQPGIIHVPRAGGSWSWR